MAPSALVEAPFLHKPRPFRVHFQPALVRFVPNTHEVLLNQAAKRMLGLFEIGADTPISGLEPSVVARLPLGPEWVWLAPVSGPHNSQLRDKLARVSRVLLQVYRHREWTNLELLRAQTQLQAHHFEVVHRRLLSKTAADFIDALESERGRIARELHDNAGQSLAGILLNLELVERHLGSENMEVTACLARSKELASLTLDQVRRISHQLHPPEWNELDFTSAVEWLVESMGLRDKMVVDTGGVAALPGLSPPVKTILYRTLQEALSNILKHAGAQRVFVLTPVYGGGVGLIVQDNGRGFDVNVARGNGIGLTNIRRRVASMGGRFGLESSLGRGARLWVFIPTEGRG